MTYYGADGHVMPKLTRHCEIVDRDRDLRRRGEKQCVVDDKAADQFPQQKPTRD
jgi:hypothetical protein